MSNNKPDFVGYATRNDVECTDGRIIRQDAFKDNDGQKVPLVWMHDHNNPDNVLGNVVLHNKPDGVMCEGYLNSTPRAKNVREQLTHGDYSSLSIFANKLVSHGKDVVHGVIREVSLCLAGANPEASIMNVAIAHSDGFDDILEDTAVIYSGDDNSYLEHSDDSSIASKKDPKENSYKKTVKDSKMANAEQSQNEDDKEETIQDVLDTMSDKQREVVNALVGMALDEEPDNTDDTNEDDEDAVKHSAFSDDEPTILVAKNAFEEGNSMKHNAFEGTGSASRVDIPERNSLMHSAFVAAQRGSFQGHFMEALADEVSNNSDSSLAHAFDTAESSIAGDGYSAKTTRTGAITNDPTGVNKYGFGTYNSLKLLFPDAKLVGGMQVLDSDESWVQAILGGVSKSPFARIKTLSYDLGDNLTEADEDKVRARGYLTGNMKFEQWYDLKGRETTPTTIYAKQKLDQDDLVDLADNFDIVPVLWNNMRLKLNQEIGLAITLGDGREATSPDKVNPTHIRPLVSENEAYRIALPVDALPKASDSDDTKTAWLNKFIDDVTVGMSDMRGTGSPSMFVGRKTILRILTARDKIGHRLYANMAALADAIGVKEIVPMDQLDGYVRKNFDGNTQDTKKDQPLFGFITNLQDYNVGTDKGGNITSFNQFDIDFNQHKYLMEGRMSGAETKLKGVMTLELPKA
jgi:HK97 family phage prohead protease